MTSKIWSSELRSILNHIEKLGLIKNGEKILMRELFNGQITKEIKQNRYKITAENLSETDSHSSNIFDQDVPKVKWGLWIEELQYQESIELTDFGTGSSEIELLIGNNISWSKWTLVLVGL